MKSLTFIILSIFGLGMGNLQAQAPIGDWSGKLDFGPVTLELVFHLKEEDGKLTGTLDSPDQNTYDIEIDSVVVDGKQVLFYSNKIGAKYSGNYDAEKIEISGTFEQNGQSFPLDLRPQELPDRPQTPLPPFNYQVEEVSFQNKEAGISLSATLTLPKGEGPHPAVVLINGSGPQDRNSTIFQHKPFWVIADALSSEGIAVIRYDERGVEQSEGEFKGATSEDFAKDVGAAMDYLKSRKDIDKNKIGLIGHSEGGMVAPMVNTHRNDVAFMVLLAPPGLKGGEVLNSQSTLMLSNMGMPDSTLKKWEGVRNEVYKIVINNEKEASMEIIDERADELLSKFSYIESAMLGVNSENLAEAFEAIMDPWFVFFLDYDPTVNFEELQTPTLAFFGEKDVQVLPEINLQAIQDALPEGAPFEHQTMENLNHLFQHADTGMPTEYREITETFSPEVLEKMASWIKAK